MEEWSYPPPRPPLPLSDEKTKPARTPEGNLPNVVAVVKCGWCDRGTLGTVEVQGKGRWERRVWFDTRDNSKTWRPDPDHVWRMTDSPKALYGHGNSRRQDILAITPVRDRKRAQSWRGPRWALTYDSRAPSIEHPHPSLQHIPVLDMQCPSCHAVTRVDLKPFAHDIHEHDIRL
jgi:hypothetical protein